MTDKRRSGDSIVFVLICVMLLALPFLQALQGWHWTHFLVVLFILGAVLSLSSAIHKAETPPALQAWKTTLLLGLLALFYLLVQALPIWPEAIVATVNPMVVTTFKNAGVDGWNASGRYALSIDAGLAMREFIRASSYFTVMLLVATLVNTRKRALFIAGVLFMSVALVAFLGLLEFFVDQGRRGRASGTFGNANLFAGFMELGIGLAVGFLYMQNVNSAYQRWSERLAGWANALLSWQALVAVLFLMLLAALFASGSRGGNAAILAALLVAIFILAKQRGRDQSSGGFAAMLVALCAFGALWLGAEIVLSRIGGGNENEPMRLSFWRSAILMTEDYPAFGMGGGSWRYSYAQYRGSDVSPELLPAHPHSDHLQMLTNYGIVGYSLFGAFTLSVLRVMLVTLNRRRDPLVRGITLGGLIATLSLQFHAFTDDNLQVATTMTYYFAIIGLALAVPQLPSASTEDSLQRS